MYALLATQWMDLMDAWKKTQYPLPQSWDETTASDDRKGASYGLAFVSLVVAVPVLVIALVVLVYAGFAVGS